MANHEPRAQRLRRQRTTRSAERNHYSKVLSHDFVNSKPVKYEWKRAHMLGIVDEEFKAQYGEDPYVARQAKREQDHLKRNARKNNKSHPHPKRPVYSPEELKRRNVLLSLPAKKPDSMNWELWRGLLKERKKLFSVSNPPLRGIPDYSAKVTPKRKKPTRYQEVYELGPELSRKEHDALVREYGILEAPGYLFVDTTTSKTGFRKILGVKRIPHYD